MKQHKMLRLLTILLFVTVNIGCDQVSKSLVRSHVKEREDIHLIDNHLILTKVENSGAFLSMGDNLPPIAKNILLLTLPALVLLALMVWLMRQHDLSRSAIFALSCVLGGGIGNIFDRIAYGSVTDFLFLHIGMFRTGIFNFADISITGGVLMLLVLQWPKKPA
jgi:signal peptidase II